MLSCSTIAFHCLVCGKKWNTLPGSILSGYGCPVCGRRHSSDSTRKSNNQFVLETAKVNPKVRILGEYINNKTKILCECADCGNKWEVIPQNLLRGQGCPKCGRIRAANKNKKTQKEFLDELKLKNPTLIARGEYVNSRTKIEMECGVCNYIWNADPTTILSGHGCPKCAGSLKKTNEQFKKELKQILPTVESLDVYSSANEKIRVRCRECGHEWVIRPHDLLRSKGCPICRKRVKTCL